MTIKTIIEENKKKAELSIFWQEMSTYLPKTLEREALGDSKIFQAFALTYPSIKKYLLSTLLDEIERENQELIGRHNARILNQFQTEMKPDMPLIAYDERVALIPAITKIAEETKKDILSTLNKYRV